MSEIIRVVHGPSEHRYTGIPCFRVVPSDVNAIEQGPILWINPKFMVSCQQQPEGLLVTMSGGLKLLIVGQTELSAVWQDPNPR